MNSFNAKATFRSGDTDYTIYRLDALEKFGVNPSRLPYSLRVLLENLLRCENERSVFPADVLALGQWDPKADPSKEISFTPARVLLQDFTGVPCVVDLAAMRAAMASLGGDPKKINPLQPVELVIDHSVQVDAYGSEAALLINRDLEYDRNKERYEFLKWGQMALDNFRVVPPNTGIVHQVNLEHLARVTFVNPDNVAYPDTLVGTDSHTTMVNGLGVLGWGVGGIEAEAAMLGQPVSMLIPQVIGFKLIGKLREGSTGTDLVLTVTEMLRKKGVVGKFVEFYGPGVSTLPLADRATIGNMAPEYGATCGIFPVDQETLNYMRLTGRPDSLIELTEKYFKEQGMFHTPDSPEAEYSDTLELDLATVEPSIAGPKRPQDRLRLGEAKKNFHDGFDSAIKSATHTAKTSGGVALLEAPTEAEREANASAGQVTNGSVVIAAITSCTNTSNPSLMLAAGLVAKKAVEKGLDVKPWVKTSLAPGSRVATDMFKKVGLLKYLEELNFDVVGYGCTTCIGNSGPLPQAISQAVNSDNLVVCSVLSGNRNFEGRINQDVKANYLMSPPLVVAYALAGTIDIDLNKDPLGKGKDGEDVHLKDIWPTQQEVADVLAKGVKRELYVDNYADVFKGDDKWNAIDVEGGDQYQWNPDSTYVKNPPYFDGMSAKAPDHVEELHGLRCLALLGDSVTTDHISPAGSIKLNSPAGSYLTDHGVTAQMFNSYGSRRGNHEVMVRGTFANIRLRNQLAPGTEGGYSVYLPTGDVTTIYDAAVQYKQDGAPLLVIAGKEYGTGSSRDWAAKGTMMLGIKAVLAQSFERIHRSNLIGMGVLPLEFMPGESAESLKLTGKETFDVVGLRDAVDNEFKDGKTLTMRADDKEFQVRVRIDTPQELLYYKNGGILQYVLRQLLNG
ncbi:MAG TPA: aconitate hydratase AcnA [Fimbriimonadaceae bacterium]|nr:aconitate hydratase AcnA [Fimbriimonadaceae bacterium]